MSSKRAVSEHWPEYIIEALLLGVFMIAVGGLAVGFESPRSPLFAYIPCAGLRAAVLSCAVGGTLAALIHSPWGQRSGAHMNPAITIAFLRLKKIQLHDALFYILAQIIGSTLGVALVAVIAGDMFTGPPVHYALTLPGPAGGGVAFVAEAVISFLLMGAILIFVGSSRLIRFTGIGVGALVCVFILVEAPLSGTSMNPARTLASAVLIRMWAHLWIYIVAPTLGMLGAAELLLMSRHRCEVRCAKLLHPADVRCIHCGYRPVKKQLAA